MAYWLTKPGLAIIQCQPHRSAVQRPATWLTLLQRQPGDLVTSICFRSHVSAADTLTLLIKASATVTVYRGHRRTLLPALFIMCIGIIRNNSLASGRARAESNPGHWARHALLHMAAECVNHSATWAGPADMTRQDISEGFVRKTAGIDRCNKVFTHRLDVLVAESIGSNYSKNRITILILHNNSSTGY